MIYLSPLLAALFLLFAPVAIPAAEVVNLKANFSSSTLTLEYDLNGTPADRFAHIDIVIVLHGKRYTPAMLTISGDFGRNVPVGRQRRIVWKHLKDIPEGLDSTFRCIVNAVAEEALPREEAAPSEGVKREEFAVNRQTVASRRTALMWSRHSAVSSKPMSHSAALKAITKLNEERFAGYNDWRMPTRIELEALVLPGQQAGWWTRVGHFIADFLTTCGFENVLLGAYWTSTHTDNRHGIYYTINTWNGVTRPMESGNYYYLWPVRDVSSPMAAGIPPGQAPVQGS